MDAFLFTACSHVAETGTGGGGWVAVHGDAIAYGNAAWDGIGRIGEAEAAAAVAGVRGAVEAFPRLSRVLVSTDGNEVQFAPWGDLAEGMDASLDPTGLLGACRDLGIGHAVRWWPGHRPGPLAPDILLVAARALAIQGRRGQPASGRVARDADWRSSLVAAVGRTNLNRALKEPGLGLAQAAAVTGIDEGSVEVLAEAGRLRRAPSGGVTLCSALEVRDTLVREGLVSWPADDFGASHFAEIDRPADLRLFVGLHLQGPDYGVAIARRWREDAKVSSDRFRAKGGRDPFKAATASALETLARRIGDFEAPGRFDVVTTHPWLATLLTDLADASEAVAVPLASLWENAATRGIVLRPRLVKEAQLRLWHGNEPLGLLACAIGAARIAALDTPFSGRSPHLSDGPDALLPRIDAMAAELGARRTREEQASVTRALFGLAPAETAMRARFESLAQDTHASYRGAGFILRPVLPGPVRGRVGMVSDAGALPCSPFFEMDDALVARWDAWWAEYADLLARHPVLALREAVLRLDGDLDIARWSKLRLRSVEAWIAGDGSCHFRVHPDRLGQARAEVRELVAACGGWPFPSLLGSTTLARAKPADPAAEAA